MIDKWHRGLFVVIVTLPFLLQAFPTPGAIPTFLPLALLLAPMTLLIRIADRGLKAVVVGDAWFAAIVSLVILTYLYGLAISVDVQLGYILREIANGFVVLFVVFTIANSEWTTEVRRQLVKSIATVIVLIGLFVSILGAYKFWLLLATGDQLGFVTAASGANYPWGTSLVTDYNFYSLTIIVAALAALYLAVFARPPVQVLLVLLAVLFMVVGTLAGSRRFWLVMPFLVILQLMWTAYQFGLRRSVLVFGLLMLGLVGRPIAMFAMSGEIAESAVSAAWDFQARLATLLDPDADFGMSSRYNLWEYAAAKLTGMMPWFGGGFDYMSRFSCEFGQCDGASYPHMPLLSAYLYGGVIAAVASLMMYIYVTVAGIRLFFNDFEFGWLLFPLLCTMIYGAVSGNGSLSIRCFVVIGAVCVGFLRANRVQYQSSS